MDVRKSEAIKNGTDIIGNRTRIKVVKNKLAAPFKLAEFDIIFGEGISKTGTILDLSLTFDLIQKSGSWFSYKGEKIGQGKENAKIFIKSNPEIYSELEEIIREKMMSGNFSTSADDAD